MSFRIADGHVDVHLRDSTQTEWAAIRRRLEQAARDPIRLQVELGNSTEAEWAAIRRRLEQAARDPIRLQVELDGDASASARLAALETRLAQLRALDRVTIHVDTDGDAEARLSRLDSRVRGLGQSSTQMAQHFGRMFQLTGQMFRHLGEQVSEVNDEMVGSGRQAEDSAKRAGRAGRAEIAMLIAALAALPPAATAAAGALTLALGGSLAGLGMLFAAQADEIREEASSLARYLGARMRDISQPFQRTWQDIFQVARDTFDELEYALEGIFARLAPAVSGFARELGDALAGLAPHLHLWASDFEVLLGELGPQMPQILDGIATGFTRMTGAIAQHPEALVGLLQGLANLVSIAGSLVAALVKVQVVIQHVFSAFSSMGDGVSVLGRGFSEIADAMTSLLEKAAPAVGFLQQLFEKLTGTKEATGAAAIDAGRLGEAFAGLAIGLSMVASAQPAANNAFTALNAELSKAADETLNLDQRLQALKNAMDMLLNPSLALYNAKTQLSQGLRNLREALEKSNGSLSRATEQSLAARQAFSSQVQTTAQLGQATLQATGNFNAARKAVAEQISTLWRLAGTNKEAQKQVLELARTFQISGKDAFGATKEARAFDAALRRIPKQISPKISADTSRARSQVAAFVEWARAQHIRILMSAINAGLTGNAEGGFYPTVRSYAEGGTERHVAQIAPGGPIRIWAEPETGGEAYIPLSPAKRRRSEEILALVAERFGLLLTRPLAFAEGGLVTTGGVKPSSPSGGKSSGLLRPDKTELLGPTPAPLTKAQQAIQQLIKQLNRSLFSSLDSINEWAKKVRQAIRQQFTGADEKLMLEWAKNIQGRLQDAAKRAQEIAARIAEARQYAADTAQAARQFASLQNLGTVAGAADIASGLEFRAGQLTSFSSLITALEKRGINRNLLRQIIDLGAAQGANVAQALLRADPETWRRLNEAQKAIDDAADRLGRRAADALYDGGQNAANGFLAGLLGQQQKLYDLMDRLADQMARRLGLIFQLPGANQSSQSSKKPKVIAPGPIVPVARASGGIVAAGQWAMVGEQGPELVQFGAPGRVYSNPATEQILTAGGGVHIGAVNMTVTVTGTWDLGDMAQRRYIAEQLAGEIREALRREEAKYL